MPKRLSWLLLLALFAAFASTLNAKDKKKAALPELVLRARTVAVLIDPDAGEPLNNPTANATARENVEKALMQWGRLQPVMEGQQADLLITVRTGRGRLGAPTIKGGPIDNRPVVIQPGDSETRIGAQQGRPPLNDPNMPGPGESPRISKEAGTPEDSFAVYLGNLPSPLDSAPVWRYTAKDCLRAPTVAAVEEFRKAIVESEKMQQPKKP